MKHGTVFLYPQLQFNFLITKVKILRIRICPGHNLECYSFLTFLIIGSMPDFDTNLSSALLIDLGSGRLDGSLNMPMVFMSNAVKCFSHVK